MTSIRQRLFLQILLIIVLLLSLIFIGNTLFLEDYFIAQQKKSLLDDYTIINQLDNYKDSIPTFIEIESHSNVDILIMDSDMAIIYTTNNYRSNENFMNRYHNMMHNGMQRNGNNSRFLMPMNQTSTEIINTHLQYQTGNDPLTNITSIAIIGTLDSGHMINIKLPIASIQSNIHILNNFLLIIGSIIILIGLFTTYFLSNYFTKPIRQMNAVTNRLKNLDFNESCNIHTNDELGQLSSSINAMSDSLSKTIHSLNERNHQLSVEINNKNILDDKRRQLLNNVSHELKTPLSLMQGYAEGLKLNIVDDKERVDYYCDVIMDESKKMNLLVQNLLDIDQVEFGDYKFFPTHMDLSKSVHIFMDKYSPQFTNKGITVTLDIAENINAYTDTMRFDQVMTNYLNNALNYCDHHKKVTMSLTISTTHGRIELFNSSEAIHKEQLDKLWDSFYKIDQARTREVGGHGLGLSIVKAIQEAANNGYGVYNVANGIVFWFEVDLAATS